MRPLILAALLAAVPAAGHAATLRSFTLLHGPDVRLSDLFDDAGPNADRRLGAAPAAGGRIVVESAQLGAIARQFGVDWKPASSGDRAVLERPGRLLPRDDVLAALRGALQSAGASADAEIELPGFAPPLVPAEADPRIAVAQLDYDPTAGRFAAVLSVGGDGMAPVNQRVAGRVDDTVELPVAAARLPAGTVLSANDMHMARVRVAMLRGDVVHAAGDAVGLQLRRPLTPGQLLARADLMQPMLVRRGSLVEMRVAANGLAVTAQGVAVDSGAIHERIRVMNAISRTVVEAVVEGPGQVSVVPGAVQRSIAAPENRMVAPWSGR